MEDRLRGVGSPPEWTRRAFERSGRPTLAVAIDLLLLGLVVFTIQEAVLGRFALIRVDAGVRENATLVSVHLAIAVYLLAAYVTALRSGERTLIALAPRLDPDRARVVLRISSRQRTVLTVVGALGVVAQLGINSLLADKISYWPGDWSPETGWHRVLGVFLAYWIFRLSALLVVESLRWSDLATALRRIDLLDTASATPFARQGLTHVLLFVGIVSFFALFLVNVRYLPMVLSVLSPTVVIAAVALWLPLRGIHHRIVDAKHLELDWCHARMREERTRLEAGAEGRRLEALLAWEARIAAVREWPLDAGTFTRFGLYLLLPLGSWAGGALVERLIDAALE
jgi:hypothetical protein